MKKTATKVVLWMGFAAAVCVDGKPIEPLDVDLLNPMLYVSEPTYARIVLRQPTELFAFRAITSTGDSLFSFDTADI